MSAALANVVGITTRPVSPAAPTGAWVRYDPNFEILKAEVEKISRVSASEVDWGKVIALSSDILENKSKDLLVASYLCLSLFQIDGYQGLAEGLEAMRHLMSGFWDGLFPETKRMKARIGAITWLSERVAIAVGQRAAKADEKEAVQACVARMKELEAILGEKLGGEAPSLGDMSRALRECQKAPEVPVATAPPAPRPAPAATAAAPTTAAAAVSSAPREAVPPSGPAETVDLSSTEGVDRAVNKAFSTLREAASFLRKGSPNDSFPYRLARFAAWARLDSLPVHTEGRTRIQPMGASAQLVERWDGMASKGEWAALLEQAEYQFEQAAFWLDTQSFVWRAMEGLGADYEGARSVVKEELAALLRRFPGLLELKFSNDTPFASPEAHAWIRREVLAGPSAEADKTPGPPATLAPGPAVSAHDDGFEQTLAQARDLSRKRRMPDAVGLLRQAVDGAASRRLRFTRKLELARFLADAKEQRLAVAQLESLDEEVKQFRLEEWDPGLSLEVLRLFLFCQQELLRREWKASPPAAQRAEELFSRLARLDAAAAMGMKL